MILAQFATITPGALVAGVAAGLLGVLAVAFVVNRRSSEPALGGETPRSAGGRFEWSWTRPAARRGGEVTAVARMLEDDAGLRQHLQDPGRLVLKGGNQLWTRLFGGYFVDLRRLPVEVDLAGVDESGELQLTVRDRMGPAVRDARLRERYAERASEIRDLVWPADEPQI